MKIATREIPAERPISFRSPGIQDARILGELMDLSYTGTIDHEGESREQCEAEITGTLTGKYGPYLQDCSFLIEENGQALSTCLVTLFKGHPLLAYSMTAPEAQGRGFARFLIERSISALNKAGYREFYLVVTDANTPALSLYRKMGFVDGEPGPPPINT